MDVWRRTRGMARRRFAYFKASVLPYRVPRQLEFFPDFDADPVWTEGGRTMISLDLLPISDELRRDIRAWSKLWEQGAWLAIDEDPEIAAQGDRALDPIMPQKPVLAERLRQELGPTWTVT